MKIAICDDEIYFAGKLREILMQYLEERHIDFEIELFSSGREFVELGVEMLQYQINPHFLYNTLESITWMVEANRNADAVLMISELAKLLRISLSKGKTIIRIAFSNIGCITSFTIQ